MQIPVKIPTTYQEQMEKLKSRGCVIDDERLCLETLKSVNYYRLTAYFLPFLQDNKTYSKDLHFSRVYRIYEFDRKLRSILFSALEEVETYLRSRFSYFHAHTYGAVGYLDAKNYSGKHDHEKFQKNLNREIDHNSQVLFVRHHLENRDGVFPIWVIIELFSFGMLSYFFNDLSTQDQKRLASDLYGTSPQNIKSWLRCCTDLRNICAHYGRLYYRVFPALPAGMKEMPDRAKRRLWGAVMALRSLYPYKEKWNADIVPAFESLFHLYHRDIDLYHIAFPKDWQQQILK